MIPCSRARPKKVRLREGRLVTVDGVNGWVLAGADPSFG
jgi:hypothetical protein